MSNMRKINDREFIWVEKYRPQCIEDLIIPEELREKLLDWREKGEIPNIGLFGSTPGTGKTSISKAIIRDLDSDAMFINASKDNGIDVIRNQIQNFASSVSFDGGTKVVILDEVDGTSHEFQKSFRGAIEEFSSNCRFILTGNFKDKIIEPVLNRLVSFDLDNIFAKHKQELAKQMYQRLVFILDNEKVNYDTGDIKAVLSQTYPSMREAINILQQSVTNNILNVDFTYNELNKLYIEICNNIKAKDFDKCRVLAGQITPSGLYHYIFNNLEKLFEPKSIPQVVVLTHHYMSSNTNARDPEITTAAYMSKLMLSPEIKFI